MVHADPTFDIIIFSGLKMQKYYLLLEKIRYYMIYPLDADHNTFPVHFSTVTFVPVINILRRDIVTLCIILLVIWPVRLV